MEDQSPGFTQGNLSTIISEAKPYRNVIKRYWTEEEVRHLEAYAL